jgi:hypothetical protein
MSEERIYVLYRPCGCVCMVLRRHSGNQTRFLQQMALKGERVVALTESEVTGLNFRCAEHPKVIAA